MAALQTMTSFKINHQMALLCSQKTYLAEMNNWGAKIPLNPKHVNFAFGPKYMGNYIVCINIIYKKKLNKSQGRIHERKS